mmetsp:Transcript_29231/g.43936  ORF Transcript_29231/g.43936 Transcript_29231/m.43936 type:complete len:80 (+) Transcript_29231:486-725(+)
MQTRSFCYAASSRTGVCSLCTTKGSELLILRDSKNLRHGFSRLHIAHCFQDSPHSFGNLAHVGLKGDLSSPVNKDKHET